jgi:hypothetical protein
MHEVDGDGPVEVYGGTSPQADDSKRGAYHLPSVHMIPPTSVTAEEALQNAFTAWYWTGYWTGVHRVSVRTYCIQTILNSSSDFVNAEAVAA